MNYSFGINAMAHNEPVPVEFLAPNSDAVVVEMCGDAQHVHRLEELGIRCGCKLRMLSPGEPCLLAIEGKKMCLRLSKSADILVQPLGT